MKFKTKVTIHKIKSDSGKHVYIFKNLYGTPDLFQFDSKDEAIIWAKKHDYEILNLTERF